MVEVQPAGAAENHLLEALPRAASPQPCWAYLASLQGVVLQLGQEKESRLCLGESQRLGWRPEVCRLCGSGGKSRKNVRNRKELGHKRDVCAGPNVFLRQR